jgi:hypothetical protein
MDPPLRIVTQCPLRELWNAAGALAATRGASLTADDVRDRLRQGPVRFVVADVGCPLRWVNERDCYAFWKGEVATHLADPGRPISRDDYPGGYAYLASEWTPNDGSRLIVLEMYH